jgi:hypothetical protein
LDMLELCRPTHRRMVEIETFRQSAALGNGEELVLTLDDALRHRFGHIGRRHPNDRFDSLANPGTCYCMRLEAATPTDEEIYSRYRQELVRLTWSWSDRIARDVLSSVPIRTRRNGTELA